MIKDCIWNPKWWKNCLLFRQKSQRRYLPFIFSELLELVINREQQELKIAIGQFINSSKLITSVISKSFLFSSPMIWDRYLYNYNSTSSSLFWFQMIRVL